MAAVSKGSSACWTCRIRRKKCDCAHPVCGGCGELRITCHYQENKPEWMDGGEKQREMVERFKAEVKHAAQRRSQRQGQPNMGGNNFVILSEQDFGSLSTKLATQSGGLLLPTTLPDDDADISLPPTDTDLNAAVKVPIRKLPVSSAECSPSFSALCSDDEDEQFLVMTYLDYVIPYLFPHYRPPLLENGRTWMLGLLLKNQALYHTALSLSSYFVGVALATTSPDHGMTKTTSLSELQKQAGVALRMIQRDLREINNHGMQDNLIESAYLMGSVLQMLSYEVCIGCTENWRMHLGASLALFEQIFQHHGMQNNQLSITVITEKIGRLSNVSRHPKYLARTSNQMAFLFFSAVLLFYDIISSTSLEEAPRLQRYHVRLLAKDGNSNGKASLELQEFVGCQNWVLILIGEIAALDAWKKDSKKRGTLSVMELVRRAANIERSIQDGLTGLDVSDSVSRTTQWSSPLDTLAQYNYRTSSADIHCSLTRIWAHAARSYHFVVVSGWHLSNPELRDNVARTIELFNLLPSPEWLRTLIWPFCVTGSLAEPEQEAAFRAMVPATGSLQVFGAMQDALAILNNVWGARGHINDSWDLAACFNVLGRRGFLV
jgi:hypothetical protein